MTIWTNNFNKQLNMYSVEPVCSAYFVVSMIPCSSINFKGKSITR